MRGAVRYAIGDLAELGGVSRRTVRYYVQERLLPAPLGVGRGNHYGPEHLDQLLRVKSLQLAGQSLDEIRAALRGGQSQRRRIHKRRDDATMPRTLWRRIQLAPGVELNVSNAVALPPESTLEELASWCRIYLPLVAEKEDPNE